MIINEPDTTMIAIFRNQIKLSKAATTMTIRKLITFRFLKTINELVLTYPSGHDRAFATY